jgi:hypothetical protein
MPNFAMVGIPIVAHWVSRPQKRGLRARGNFLGDLEGTLLGNGVWRWRPFSKWRKKIHDDPTRYYIAPASSFSAIFTR